MRPDAFGEGSSGIDSFLVQATPHLWWSQWVARDRLEWQHRARHVSKARIHGRVGAQTSLPMVGAGSRCSRIAVAGFVLAKKRCERSHGSWRHPLKTSRAWRPHRSPSLKGHMVGASNRVVERGRRRSWCRGRLGEAQVDIGRRKPCEDTGPRIPCCKPKGLCSGPCDPSRSFAANKWPCAT